MSGLVERDLVEDNWVKASNEILLVGDIILRRKEHNYDCAYEVRGFVDGVVIVLCMEKPVKYHLLDWYELVRVIVDKKAYWNNRRINEYSMKTRVDSSGWQYIIYKKDVEIYRSYPCGSEKKVEELGKQHLIEHRKGL